ncbi:MAG: hypothetical protein JJE25_12830 [Bacteroidia bacterium]|nr:hypothetical protein [Bacteroidia bacterium]
MARINFPGTFAGVVKLFGDIKKKHDADGASSVLILFLEEQAIDMDVDAQAVTDASEAHNDFEKHEKNMEELSEKRDNLFDEPFDDHRGCVQFLKKLFLKNNRKLGDWGVTVDGRGRVVYAKDFSGKAAEVLALIAKHDSFAPGSSPLQPFLNENDIDLAANETDVENAQTAHDDFVKAEKAKEQFRETRDLLIGPIGQHERGMGQFLIGLFPKAPKKAGQWGFVVDDSPRAKKKRIVLLQPGEIKTLYHAVMGSNLTLKKGTRASIYPGKAVNGTPVTINEGETFIIRRKFGTFTIKNESNSSNVEIIFTENR